MFATKTRNTIIALIASSGLAASALAPAVSQAQKIQTAPHKITHAEACSTLGDLENKANEEVIKYLGEGDTVNAEAASTVANLYFDEGVREGCWVAGMHAPVVTHPISVIGSGVGALPTK
jgi:hypothetical protein